MPHNCDSTGTRGSLRGAPIQPAGGSRERRKYIRFSPYSPVSRTSLWRVAAGVPGTLPITAPRLPRCHRPRCGALSQRGYRPETAFQI
jgi:hypothetical protein